MSRGKCSSRLSVEQKKTTRLGGDGKSPPKPQKGTPRRSGGLRPCPNDMHPKSWTLLEVHIFMSREKKFNTRYSAEFKISVIMDMRENHLSYRETVRKYWDICNGQEHNYTHRLKLWERIYLEEGAAGLMTERRGRKSTGRPRKKPLDKVVENDLIAENQRLKERNQYLEAELECIKKLSALVIAEEQEKSKKL